MNEDAGRNPDRHPEHVFRTSLESSTAKEVAKLFERCSDPLEVRLDNFPKYVRRVPLKRFLAMYEIFKMILPVKGSIVECGVFRGFGVMAWAKLSAILEPENLTRRIYGFDTFEGFPTVHDKDHGNRTATSRGDLRSDSYEELQALIKQYDQDRFLGHIPKVVLVKGDMTLTIPSFIETHPHLAVSLLFLDCDLYEPTKAALDALVPRMPKGAIIAFDEVDNPKWPGETLAALDSIGLGNMRLRRLEWDPYISFAEIE
jgi:hypothetical protein